MLGLLDGSFVRTLGCQSWIDLWFYNRSLWALAVQRNERGKIDMF